jgi:outer membrane lipoprotein-sorting protein
MTHYSKRTLFIGLVAGFIVCQAMPVLAQGKNTVQQYIIPPKFSAPDKARVDRAVAYLQAMTTGTGRFEQTDFKGRTSQGNWYLQRPGKIRFEYDAPYALLVVADGKRVNMWDPRLKAFNRYPLDATPLSLFLSRQIRLDQGVIVTEVKSTTDGFQLKARDRRKDVEGSIQMVFKGDGANLTLGEWVVTDAQGRGTRIKLLNFNKNISLRPDLFILNKPKDAK